MTVSFAAFLFFLGMASSDASRYGLLRVGSFRGATPSPEGSEMNPSRRLANEDFQIMFRTLFSYESSGADSMKQLSMAQLSMAQLSMTQLSMTQLSMAGLSFAPLSMVGLSMMSIRETVSPTSQEGHGDNNNDSTIQGPGGNEGIQVNDGMRAGLSTGLMAAGFLMLVLAAVSVYKMKRYAALSQTIDDELSVPTAV